jgi:hypothetical protein
MTYNSYNSSAYEEKTLASLVTIMIPRPTNDKLQILDVLHATK